MVLGHFFALRPRPSPEKDTLGHGIASRFRRPLTAKEYGRLQAVIARIRAAHHSWSASRTIATTSLPTWRAASACGTPTTVSLPYAFIPLLPARNEDIIRSLSAPGLGRLAALQ